MNSTISDISQFRTNYVNRLFEAQRFWAPPEGLFIFIDLQCDAMLRLTHRADTGVQKVSKVSVESLRQKNQAKNKKSLIR